MGSAYREHSSRTSVEEHPPCTQPSAQQWTTTTTSAPPPARSALVPPVSPTLTELGEAHFWPHARAAGDLTSPGAVKIVTRGDGVWVYDQTGSRYLDTLSGLWLRNIGDGP